ncbi:MAG TPA: MFS transporter [Gaiellaceae bacterium]|nr:MFS transporter [Gaiellaceae bacterium]
MTSDSPTSSSALPLLAAGIALTGLNLRLAVASVPPIVEEIQRDVGLSATAAGLLTAAPVLCFGLLAPAAPMLARRFGAERVMFLALVPIVVGVAGRAAGSEAALFAGTLLAGAGVAVANVIVPSVVKGRFRQSGAITGVYLATLTAGVALAAGLTVPLERRFGWEAALALWAVPAAVAALVVAAAVFRAGGSLTARGEPGGGRRLLGDLVAWQVTGYMGLQSLVFYAALAWLPSILRDDGFSAASAGTLLAVFALAGVPGSLAVPVLATRVRDQRFLAVAVTGLEALAVIGLLVAPGAALVWVVSFALGQGGALGLALMLMVLRAPDARRAAQLSGMAQAIGYCVAATGPWLLGALYDWTGDWDDVLVALLVLTVPLAAVGVAAGRARLVRGEV